MLRIYGGLLTHPIFPRRRRNQYYPFLFKVNNEIFRDDKRVLECLQKSMRIADASILDPATSITVFIEILNHYLYYFDKDPNIFDQSVQKYITNLVEMIKGRMDELGGQQAGAQQIGGISGVVEPDGLVDEWVRRFFERSMGGVSAREL
jgi:hypothetical protein